jgi:hypothetical protein
MMAPLLLIVALALQPPVPSGGKREGGPPAANPQPAQNDPAANARGTEASPFIVKVQQTPKAQEQAAQEQRDRDEKATANRWGMALSGLAALATIGLVWIGFGQIHVMRQQNKIMDRQTTIMEDQKKAASSSAIAAAEAVKLTEKQQTILEQQHAAITKQSEHMEGQLIAARISADAAKASSDALKVVHRQWLQIGPWEITIAPLGKTGKIHVMFRVRVVNTSKLPLTIRTVRCYINGKKGGHAWSNGTIGPDENHWEEMFAILTDAEQAAYEKSGHRATFVLAGWVDYWDAFNETQQQMIGAHLTFAPGQQIQVRGLADLPRNLGRMARENPWPLEEPDFPEVGGAKRE